MKFVLQFLVLVLIIVSPSLSSLLPSSSASNPSNGLLPITQGSVASSPWPMFHHDMQHTGLSQYVGSLTPTIKWAFRLNTTIASVGSGCTSGTSGACGIDSSPIIGPDGTIYIAGRDYYLYALNPDGTEKWQFNASAPFRSTPTLASNSLLYVGSDIGSVFAINSTDGTLVWNFSTGRSYNSGAFYASPAIGANGTIYLGSYNGSFYAINPNGTERWMFQTGSTILSSAAIGQDGTIYFGSHDGYFYALNPDGSLNWSLYTGSLNTDSPAIGSDGTIYFGNEGSFFSVFPNGTVKWILPAIGRFTSAPAIGPDGTIYVGNYNNNLYAINENGTIRWKFTAMSVVESSPAVDAQGTAFVGSADNNLYAVLSNGTLEWKITTGDQVESSPAIGSDGTVYVGSYDNYLYAIGSNSISAATVIGKTSSTNWAGYVITAPTGSVTQASASWKVPTITCNSGSQTQVAFWVGIDGYDVPAAGIQRTIEQVGTFASCTGGTTAMYSAWYEFFPQQSSIQVILSITVHAGDTISASVTFHSNTNKFTVKITDLTTSQSFKHSGVVSNAQRNSAEWITEAPTSGSTLTPLANFGTASYGKDYTAIKGTCYATIGGLRGPINFFAAQPIGTFVQKVTMATTGGAVKALPSALSKDKSSFTTSWAGP